MQAFIAHLNDPAPGFRCYRPGTDAKALDHEVGVSHRLGSPATDASLATLEGLLGGRDEQFAALYALHDGMTLYVEGFTAGLRLYRVDEVAEKKRAGATGST